ncbi:hypothetical protein PW52_10875 [Tamlana sedimentorum]|uniref:Tetratricopeptide repeat protein n=1 Tax=Neotamlana sedimentorum TaxID=1435349 RepID=A0A0D7W904_9FLAO|nr:hypothetical protein [Tamlana sedimentorum]KJD35178.1 hypothetical protein PW52_10875 [Tamlana sedimentorum]
MEEEKYIQFEAYLEQNLNEEELEAFEHKLKTDSDFNEGFQTYKSLNQFLDHKFKNEDASEAFKNNLEGISNAYFNKDEASNKKQKPFNFYKYAVAACVVALLGFFVFNQFSTPAYSDFNNYNAISLTVRGENDALLKTAETAFNNKDFAKAEDTFSALIKLDATNAEYKLYSAISNLELNNFKTAEALLNDVKSGHSVYKNKAIWFLGLSKLKQEDYKSCLNILKTIPEGAEDYKRAQKLINKLD